MNSVGGVVRGGRMSWRAPEEFAREAASAKHRSNEAQRSAFVLRRRTRQILSEAGPAASSFVTFLTARKVYFLKENIETMDNVNYETKFGVANSEINHGTHGKHGKNYHRIKQI